MKYFESHSHKSGCHIRPFLQKEVGDPGGTHNRTEVFLTPHRRQETRGLLLST